MKKKVDINRGKSTYSIFYKYLISFFLVALVPIGIGVASFYQYNVTSLRRQTYDISRQKFEQKAQLLDDVIYNHFKTAAALAVEPLLQSSRLLGDSYGQYQCLSYLKPYLSRNQEIEKSYLIMKNQDIVYTATGMMSLNALGDIALGWENSQIKELNTIIQENTGYLPVGDRVAEKYLIFLHPVPAYRPYAYLMFLMDKEAVYQLLGKDSGEESQEFLLTTKTGDVLNSDFNQADLEEMKSAWQLGGQNGIRDTGWKESSVFFYISDTTELVYAGSFSEDGIFMRQMERQRNLLILFCFLILFLCMGIAFGVASFTYKPIRDLLRILDKPERQKNEMLALHEYIMDQKTLSDSVRWQTPYVQQRIMELYLEGLIDETEQQKAFSTFHFNSENNCYFAIVFLLKFQKKGINNSQYRQKILNCSLELELKEDVHICHMEKFMDSTIVWIVNVDSKEYVTKMLLNIRQEFQKFLPESEVMYGAGVGGTVKTLTQIRDSYYEAMAAAEYLQEYERENILFYSDLAGVLEKEEMPDGEHILKLVQALRKGDKRLSAELFREYRERLRQKYKSLILYHYFEVQFYKGLTEALRNYVPQNCLEELSELAAGYDMENRDSLIEKELDKICDFRTSSQKSKQIELSEKILTYIRENAFQTSLSLDSLGDEFGLSPYYISRFMTEQTGENLKSYITRLRMEEAKKLLTQTALPLYEIVSRIGYLDVSSFIRKFKKEVGMTPGEYREKYGL